MVVKKKGKGKTVSKIGKKVLYEGEATENVMETGLDLPSRSEQRAVVVEGAVAQVEVKRGITLNRGNFQSTRYDVSVKRPVKDSEVAIATAIKGMTVFATINGINT